MSHRPHLLVLSHLRWDFVFQRPQQLMSRLAQQYRVIYIEEPVHDPAGPPRVEARFVGSAGDIEVMVPFSPVAAVGFDDRHLPLCLPLIERELAKRAVRDFVVWLYTPMALPWIGRMQPRALVYDCMDELSAFKNAPTELLERETALMASADLVLCGGPALHAARRGKHPNLYCLPSAVDGDHFAPPRGGSEDVMTVRAKSLQGRFERPRLGYFGVIDERMDLALLEEIADARPDWQLMMVGPVVKIANEDLPRRPSIHWLGMQPYDLLPHLMADWDVCLMPFALNQSTQFISPTKTLEYLAGGKPVVSTPIHDVIGLYGDVVRIARDAAEFVIACEELLAEDSASREYWRTGAAAIVAASSWDATAAHAADRLAKVLKPFVKDGPIVGHALDAA